MNLPAQFKEYLLSQSNPPSKITVKNYLSDINKFIRWIEAKLGYDFNPSEINQSLIDSFKEESLKSYSASSVERSLSSLRKFFYFLKLEGKISQTPFEVHTIKSETPDPWKLKEFKNHLYVFGASHLTIKNYIIDVKQFLTWADEVVKNDEAWEISKANNFSKITSGLIEEYKKRLLNEAHLSPVSVNRKLSSIRRFISWANEEGLIKDSADVVNLPSNTSGFKANIPDALAAAVAIETLSSSDTSAGNEYSAFPPLRVYQKTKEAGIAAFDNTVTAPLADVLDKSDEVIWNLKGRPVFKDRLKASFKIPSFKLIDPKKINNVPKSFYAPALISTANFPLHKKVIHHARHSRPKWYKTYHSYAFSSYLHFSILMLFISAMGYMVFNDFNTKQQAPILAALPSAPPRILSFQGRLTDANDNPITKGTTLRMAIYNNQTASGSALLWQETVSPTPDDEGIFSILLGNNNPIPQSLFAQNSGLWLGVTVENTQELKPRQQIATVAFAANAETLQGLPPITNTTATSNVVLALNSSGNLTIGGTANPIFQATGGTFTVSGRTLVLTTSSNGNIRLAPNGTGIIDIQKSVQNTTNTGLVVPGSVTIEDLFSVIATSSGHAVINLSQGSTGDLIIASTSGSTKFRIDNGGNLTTAGSLNGLGVSSGTITSGTWQGTAIGAPYGGTGQTSYSTGDMLYASDSTVISKLSIGSNGTCLTSNGTTPSWVSCLTASGGTGYWNQSAGAIFPNNATVDLLVGGQSTESAKFAITNIAGSRGSQTASISGNIMLDSSNANIQSTQNQTLSFGGNSTGLIQFNNNNGNPFATFNPSTSRLGIGSENPEYLVDVVNDSGDASIRIKDSTNSLEGIFTTGGSSLDFGSLTNTPVIFYTNNDTKIRLSADGGLSIGTAYSDIDASQNDLLVEGNVGIGTTNPLSQLTVGEIGNGPFDLLPTGGYSAAIRSEGDSNNGIILVASDFESYGGALRINVPSAFGSVGYRAQIQANSYSGNMDLGLQPTGGNVAIGLGSIDATAKLDVAGTASVGGQLTFRSGTAQIQSTAGQTLTLGGTTTGVVQVNNKANTPFVTFDTVNSRVGIGSTATAPIASIDIRASVPRISFLDSDSAISSTNPAWSIRSFDTGNFSISSTPSFSTSFVERLVIDNAFRLGVGTSTPTSELHVTRPLSFGANGRALAIFDQIENQDILTASKSGVAKFTIDQTGNIKFAGGQTNANSTLASLATTAQTYTFPATGGTVCLSTNNCSFSTGANYWQLNSNLLSPINSTYDFAIGGTASTAAKFAVLNVASGTPTASISGNSGSGATFLSGGGQLGTTSRQALFLGNSVANSTTGDVFINSNAASTTFRVGIGTSDTTSTNSLAVGGAEGDLIRLIPAGGTVNDDAFVTMNSRGRFGYDGTLQAVILSDANAVKPLIFLTSPGGTSIERLRIDTNGRFGFNDSSPLATLEVAPSPTNGGTVAIASFSGSTTFAGLVVDNTGNGDLLTASKSGATKFVINNQGSTTITSTDQVNTDFTVTNPYGNTTQYITASGVDKAAYLQLNGNKTTNDTVGNIGFRNNDDSIAYLSAYRDGANDAGALAFETQISGVSGTNNRMWIDSNGAIGMGTTNPASQLHVTRPVSNVYPALGKALAIFDQIEDQDVLTASFSGTPVFRVRNFGDIEINDNTAGGWARGLVIKRNNFSLDVGEFGAFGVGDTVNYLFIAGDDDDWNNPIIAFTPTGNVGIGTSQSLSPSSAFYVTRNLGRYAATGQALAILDQTENQDIFTASASGTPRFVIKNDGSTGIGTSTPNAFLDVAGTASVGGQFTFRSGTAQIQSTANQTLTIGGSTTGYVALMPNNGAGKVGIGTTTPKNQLHIFQASNPTLRIGDGSAAEGWSDSTLGEIIFGNHYDLQEKTIIYAWGNFSTTGYTPDLRFKTDSQDRMTILGSGAVGIGTTAPLFRLHTETTQSATAAALFYNSNTGSNADGIIVKLGAASLTSSGCGNNGNCNEFITFLNGDGLKVGKIHASGTNTIAYKTNGSDFAELFINTDSEKNLPEGTLMCSAGKEKVERCGENNNSILGIISERAGFIGGKEDPNAVTVGLVGQVPALVNSGNGQIKKGDFITVSSQPGIGTKAINAGFVVGRAMEDDDGSGKVWTMINTIWYDPDVQLADAGYLTLAPTIDDNFEVRRQTGETVNRIGAFSEILVAKIKAGYLETGKLIVTGSASVKNLTTETLASTIGNFSQLSTDSLVIGSENINVAGQSLREYITSIVEDVIGENENEDTIIVSPILATDIITPKTGKTLSVKLNSDDESSSFKIMNLSGSTVASIDALGNASLSGALKSESLQTGDASVSGILRADKIIANQIEGLNIQASSVSANYITNNYYQATPSASYNEATGSASFDNLVAMRATFEQGLMAFGPASFYEASVADRLFVGSKLSLADTSINVLGGNLELQPLRQGGVSLVGGLVEIDVDGNLKVNGNAYFAKDVDIKGKLLASFVSPLPGRDFVLELGRRDEDGESENHNSSFVIRNSSASALLSVNNQGDLNASGAGTFNKLNLSIVNKALALSPTEVIATGSAGTAEIQPNREELTIRNSLVTEDSLIYITTKTSTQSESVYLLRQVPGKSFTVGISNPINKKVPFNWIIIN